MTAPARRAAYQALRAIVEGRQDLPIALADSRRRLEDQRDRALALEIVTGTLRWQRAVDHVIVHYAGRPVGRLDTEVLIVLRLSIYQLLHLDRVPASAVVDDAVDLTRMARKPSACGFVNGVLRALLRERRHAPFPQRPSDPADRAAAVAYLGVTHSHPEWLIRRWLDRFGFDAVERWVRFNNEAPPLTLRANRLRATVDQVAAALAADGIQTERMRYSSDALSVTAGNPLSDEPDGRFAVQDEASQLVALVAGARPGECILDLCAAPGGKTIAMAADMSDRGLVVACDVRARRMRLLQRAVRRAGASSIRIVQVGDEGPVPFARAFDRILVDAPCSGLGTIRRDPDIRWRRQPDDLPRLAAAQRSLLGRAAAVLKPHGCLVYSTCSSEPEENDEVIDSFLEAGTFELIDLRTALLPPAVRMLIDDRGVFRTLPFLHGLEAFFAAALRPR